MAAACAHYQIDTPERLTEFLAQLGHESGGLRYVREVEDGSAYEGRVDLGNTEPGDGRRFRGRGYVTVNPQPISGAVQLLNEDSLLIAKLLHDVESWFYARKQCLPRSTAIIELHSGAGEAQVLIGMDCEAWDLLVGGRRQHGFFDPVADQVRAVLKRTFPEIASPDARSMWMSGAIQRLKYEFSSQQTLVEQSAEPELPNSRL